MLTPHISDTRTTQNTQTQRASGHSHGRQGHDQISSASHSRMAKTSAASASSASEKKSQSEDNILYHTHHPSQLRKLRRTNSMDGSHFPVNHKQGSGVASQGRVSIVRGGQEVGVKHTNVYEKISKHGQTQTRIWDRAAKGNQSEPNKVITDNKQIDKGTANDQFGSAKSQNMNNRTAMRESQITKRDAEALMLTEMVGLTEQLRKGNILQPGDVVRFEFHGNDGPCNGCKGRIENFSQTAKSLLSAKQASVEVEIFYNDAKERKRTGNDVPDTHYGWPGASPNTSQTSYLAQNSKEGRFNNNSVSHHERVSYGQHDVALHRVRLNLK